VTRRSAVIVSDNCCRRTYFKLFRRYHALSTHSAVEMLYDSALYKFMIDIDITKYRDRPIDIDIDIKYASKMHAFCRLKS